MAIERVKIETGNTILNNTLMILGMILTGFSGVTILKNLSTQETPPPTRAIPYNSNNSYYPITRRYY